MELQKVEWKEASESPLTRFLAFPSAAVIVTGPFSCVCFAKDTPLEKEKRNRLFLCEMKQSDYITGKCREKVLEAAGRAAEIPGVEQIVIYQCCTDYLTHTDYEAYLRRYFAPQKTLRIYTFQRGSASLNYSRKKEIAEQIRKDAEAIRCGKSKEQGLAQQEASKDAKQGLAQQEALNNAEAGRGRRIADYASVCAAFRDTDALICIFSPGSCTGALYAAGLKSGENIYMSRLTDTELITGCGRAFAKEAARRAEMLGTKRILLLGTPVTRLLYTDFKETAELLSAQGFCAEFYDTSGYETVEAGKLDQ